MYGHPELESLAHPRSFDAGPDPPPESGVEQDDVGRRVQYVGRQLLEIDDHGVGRERPLRTRSNNLVLSLSGRSQEPVRVAFQLPDTLSTNPDAPIFVNPSYLIRRGETRTRWCKA